MHIAPKASCDKARTCAYRLVLRVINHRETLDIAMNKEPSWTHLDTRDKSFTRQLLGCSLRHKGQLEQYVQNFLSKPLPARKQDVGLILLLASAEHFFMRSPKHAIVNQYVNLAASSGKTRPFKSLINAILRKVCAGNIEQLPFPNQNIPPFLQQRWEKNYGQNWLKALSEALLHEPPLDIYLKTGKKPPQGAIHLIGNCWRIEKREQDITILDGYKEGHWWVQDFAAQLPLYLTNQKLGSFENLKVLDLCAAPGGKTMQLANQGAAVTALDIDLRRLKRLEENLKRTKLSARLHSVDALKYQEKTIFDLVVIDAPCSATGTLRRRPELLYLRNEKSLLRNVALQKHLLEKAVQLTKDEGYILYIVCSLEPEEGPVLLNNIETLGLKPIPLNPNTLLSESLFEKHGMLQTAPHLYCLDSGKTKGMDGFFAALMQKK